MKKTGKALSLVLSMALVVSSLTATFASAATSRPSETATIALTNAEIALSNGGADAATLTSPELASADYLTNIKSAELPDHSDVKGALSLKDVAVTGGSDKVKLYKHADSDGNLDNVTLTLKNASVTGTVTLAARYEGKVQRGDDEDANTRVYGTATFTATIYQAGKAYIAGGDDATAPGANPAALETMAMNADQSVKGVVETPSTDKTAAAKWNVQPIATAVASETQAAAYYVISATGATDTSKITTATAASVFTIANKPKNGAKVAPTGKVSLLAQGYSKDNVVSKSSNDRASAKTAVDEKYIAAGTDTTISKYSSKTYIGTVPATKATTTDLIEVTSCAIDLSACTTKVTMTGGKIGDVTTAALSGDSFEVQDGVVGNVTAKGATTVSGGSVGNVTISETKTLTVNGGAVKDVDGNGEIDAVPSDSDTAVKTGALSAKTIKVDSNDKNNVTTGDVTAVSGATITLSGDMVKVGKIDGDYHTASLNLDNFKGSIAAPVHTYTEGINDSAQYLTLNVSGEDANATVTGTASFNDVTLADGASLTFADKVNVGDQGVSGDGVLKFAPNALYTTGDITTSIRLTKDFKVGDVAFTAATDAVDEDSFTGVGFTAEKVATSTKIDSFKVKTISFASIDINGSAKIPVGTTETYTATNYPSGTQLPDGYKISWTFSGNSDYLVATVDENDSTKVSVKAVKEDKTFTSLNKGTLTATVVDADGFADDAYTSATFDVSIGAKPATFTTDSFPTSMKLGQSYQVKITGTDATKPVVAFASNFAKAVSTTTSGNDTFVKFTVMTPNAGSYGVYVSGDKKAVIAVGNACDTKTVTKTNGQNYTFKVTALSAPTFAVATVGTIKPSKVSGNDYFYTVKATANKGAHGVYINGFVAATYTFA